MNDLDRIKRAAEGRWPEIFAAAGMDPAHFERENRPCPLCGGRDRFSFFRKEEQGRWFCRGCGWGDGIDLVRKFTHRTFPETLRWLESYLGLPPEERRMPEARTQTEDPAAEAVRRYLALRGLGGCDASAMLRAEALAPCWDASGGERPRLVGRFPTMLARVTDAAGGLITLHRTYLTAEGAKAPVPAAKKLAPGAVEGGLVRLFPPTAILCLAEGIETALSVHEMTGLPAWSAISLTGFRRFETVPDCVEVVRICGDNDRSYAGAVGAYELAARLKRSRPGLEVSVHIPAEAGTDWNDVLMQGGRLSF